MPLPSLNPTIEKETAQLFENPFEVITPPESNQAPVILCLPHSGRTYPLEFIRQSRLEINKLRRSEDSFVDALLENAPQEGASMIVARFPRAWLDVNREPYELDPTMFSEPLPPHVNRHSPRVGAGLGVIARIVSEDVNIYKAPLQFAEVEQRIRHLYFPFHTQLQTLMTNLRHRFGYAVLVDCHSMPSGPISTTGMADIVLGDRYATTATSALVDHIESHLTHAGYKVARNRPYAGGFITQRHGHPSLDLHALQIEINRALYMNEKSFDLHHGFTKLQHDMTTMVREIVTLSPEDFGFSPKQAAQ
ncbi:MAG: N-formylglutamate amidohydrolase [Parvularculales bacterium]